MGENFTFEGFQFHKVRLKAFGSNKLSTNTLFQFHKVRLKAYNSKRFKVFFLFQFHKVRLKGAPRASRTAHDRVSIP